ncbi:hypothetical protein [Paenibacillus sp. RC67]|uniref:hypothetical protein n=1 Tax=Paenibacillus sp. RC67 TaxID=3039392 RepID=UPI0024AD638D|nr:hypothetical protein [Paenibacillus sp. RC67]
MENITAFFKNSSDMNLAAEALREQGAIDIQLHSGENAASDSLSMLSLLQSSQENNEEIFGYVMQVVVESSRYRQAEDTLASFGGQR